MWMCQIKELVTVEVECKGVKMILVQAEGRDSWIFIKILQKKILAKTTRSFDLSLNLLFIALIKIV